MNALLLIAAILLAPLARAQFAAGYDALTITRGERPIRLDIWYPTQAKEGAVHYGISAGSAATGAPPAGAKHPLVLLSHGAMGTAGNYSWLAEPLARRGLVVLGVSHFGESPVLGAQDPAAVGRFGDRTRDFNRALEYVMDEWRFASVVDAAEIHAVGHSSGGATALLLAGATVSKERFVVYCDSEAASVDRGCRYRSAAFAAPEQAPPQKLNRRIRSVVLLDPAAGPAFDEASIAGLDVRTLVVGSTRNDFLPYEAHAGRLTALLPHAEAIRLADGEGHFLYLDVCTLPIDVMGVPLCRDREGVDRGEVHRRLVERIVPFLERNHVR